jgi:hypothetical protein
MAWYRAVGGARADLAYLDGHAGDAGRKVSMDGAARSKANRTTCFKLLEWGPV